MKRGSGKRVKYVKRREPRRDPPRRAKGHPARAGERAGVRLFAEVVGGLEELSTAELLAAGAKELEPVRGGLRFTHHDPGSLIELLRSVSGLFRELRFAVPRPKALLGDQALRDLSSAIVASASGHEMRSFRLAAAGADSVVFQRLARELSATTGLQHEPLEGSMLIRVRPYGSSDRGAEKSGWEVLLRLTERPLATRSWRLCNRPGGLNSTVAYAMNELLGNDPRANYLNLMCGSGTLLVERAISGVAGRLVGVDIEQTAIDCAGTNLAAAGVSDYQLLTVDIRDLTRELVGGFEEIAADAPWGDAVGSHATNEELHLRLLGIAAELAVPGAGFALLSHEVKISERLLPQVPAWSVESSKRVEHGGHRPLLLLLRRV